jgi:hypothetical protein
LQAGRTDSKSTCGIFYTEKLLPRLRQWAREQPLSAPELLQHHTDATGESIHADILIRHLKEGGLMWKRTRHSLKKREMKPLSSAAERR